MQPHCLLRVARPTPTAATPRRIVTSEAARASLLAQRPVSLACRFSGGSQERADSGPRVACFACFGDCFRECRLSVCAFGSRGPDGFERLRITLVRWGRLVCFETVSEFVRVVDDLLHAAGQPGHLPQRNFERAGMACTTTGPSSLSTTPTSSSRAARSGPISMVIPSSISHELTGLRQACAMLSPVIPCLRALCRIIGSGGSIDSTFLMSEQQVNLLSQSNQTVRIRYSARRIGTGVGMRAS